MPTYKVSGYAMVPMLCQITVEAASETLAIVAAERAWKASERKSDFIVPRSQDETSIHDFRGSSAARVK